MSVDETAAEPHWGCMLVGCGQRRVSSLRWPAVASWGCDESPISPGQTTSSRPHRISRIHDASNGSSTVGSAMRDGSRCHSHPSELAQLPSDPLQPVPPDRYELTFSDVPVATRVSFRVNDQNACDENPTGAVTRNVFANEVRLIQNATTPGNGDEPGYALSVAADGTISQ